jgi:hypothetical protein
MNDRIDKNHIFQQQGAQQTVQKQNLAVPDVEVSLPSRGKLYPPGHSLHLAESVGIYSMGTAQEDILTNKSLAQKGTTIQELIRSVLCDKSIDVSDMLIGDKSALLIAIRITGFGHEYETEMTCPKCENKSAFPFDLSALPIRELEIEPVSPGVNEFEYTLPSGTHVTFKFLSEKEETEIQKISEKLQKGNLIMQDKPITTRLKYQILSVNGNRDKSYIGKFCENVKTRDSRPLRKYMNDNEPGISIKQPYICSKCEFEKEVVVPLGPQFFWPDM